MKVNLYKISITHTYSGAPGAFIPDEYILATSMQDAIGKNDILGSCELTTCFITQDAIRVLTEGKEKIEGITLR
jgi:hypothetical protein